jgi:riboflavin synthase
MFTGIIEQTGTLVSLESRGGVHRITVEASGLAGRLREGDSLGVSGVCLTALDVDPTLFHADLAQETLGGHIVQGHVDGCGALASLEPVIPQDSPEFDRETTDWTLKVTVPENVRPWMVLKGSVAIEGISLTIADFDGEAISIAILPLTYWRTNLHTLSVGAPVNVEADVLVKLAYSTMLAEKKPTLELTESWLVACGY